MVHFLSKIIYLFIYLFIQQKQFQLNNYNKIHKNIEMVNQKL